MTNVPDLSKALDESHGDPFLHGTGETLDEVFSGTDEKFSASFYTAQADEARARQAADEDADERKKCDVFCVCHLNPHDYVPVCPRHGTPLIAAEAGNGQCRWVGPVQRRHIGGTPFERNRCIAWGPGAWEWRKKSMFNQSDLPPFNGFNPPKTPSWMEPRTWGFETHDCPTCGETRHTVGDDRLVCLTCGLCRWTKDIA